MEGNITTNEQMERITSELGLKREGCRYQVLYIGVAPRHAHNLDAEALKLCIENHDILVQEALKRYFPDTGHIYKPGDAAFACLIAVPSARSDNENTEQNIQIFRSVHQELLKLYDIEIRGGLGNICEVVPYIWKSYQEAHNAWSMTTDQRPQNAGTRALAAEKIGERVNRHRGHRRGDHPGNGSSLAYATDWNPGRFPRHSSGSRIAAAARCAQTNARHCPRT